MISRNLSFFLFALALATAGCSNRAGEPGSRNGDVYMPRDLDIYLLIGQSNMAGRAELTAQVREPLERVYLYRGEPGAVWEPAANPLNIYSTIRKESSMQRLGPGYGFARRMSSFSPERDIGLVVNAQGGTSLGQWMPGTEFYREALRRVREAAASGTVRGILWHQGESDLARLENYMEDLAVLISAFREDLGNAALPFVAGQLSDEVPSADRFNRMILRLPDLVAGTGVAGSEGTTTFDGVHFDTESQLLLGERYAEVMITMTTISANIVY